MAEKKKETPNKGGGLGGRMADFAPKIVKKGDKK